MESIHFGKNNVLYVISKISDFFKKYVGIGKKSAMGWVKNSKNLILKNPENPPGFTRPVPRDGTGRVLKMSPV